MNEKGIFFVCMLAKNKKGRIEKNIDSGKSRKGKGCA